MFVPVMGWGAAGGGGDTPGEIWGTVAHLLLSPQVSSITEPEPKRTRCLNACVRGCTRCLSGWICVCVQLRSLASVSGAGVGMWPGLEMWVWVCVLVYSHPSVCGISHE